MYIQASWCSEQDIPANLIDEFNQQIQSQIELLTVNYRCQSWVKICLMHTLMNAFIYN